MRPKKKIVICITEYCKIVQRGTKPTDRGGAAWRNIDDFDMFAKGIYATEEEEADWETDTLQTIMECLREVLNFNRGKYSIQEVAQKNDVCVRIPVFLELYYIAFQKRRDRISFLRTFIQVHYLYKVNGTVSENEIESYRKSLGKEWEKEIVNLYEQNISGNAAIKNRSILGDICKTDKNFFSNMEKNCIRGKNSIHDMNS